MVSKLICSTSTMFVTVFGYILLIFVQLSLDNFRKIIKDPPFYYLHESTPRFFVLRKLLLVLSLKQKMVHKIARLRVLSGIHCMRFFQMLQNCTSNCTLKLNCNRTCDNNLTVTRCVLTVKRKMDSTAYWQRYNRTSCYSEKKAISKGN